MSTSSDSVSEEKILFLHMMNISVCWSSNMQALIIFIISKLSWVLIFESMKSFTLENILKRLIKC